MERRTTPLHVAVREIRTADDLDADSAVREWMTSERIDTQDEEGRTAFYLACCAAIDESVPRALREAGADPTIRDDGQWSPGLAAFTVQDSRDVLAWIIRAQILGLNETGPLGWPALHLWAAHGQHAVAGRLLIEAGADVQGHVSRDDPVTPLHVAARFSDSPDVLMTLIEAGADGRRRDRHGRTPYDLARLAGQKKPERQTERWRRVLSLLYDAASAPGSGRRRSFGPPIAKNLAQGDREGD